MTALGKAFTSKHNLIEVRNNDIRRLREAIHDKGPHPDYHDSILARHRAEWPTLWAVLDEMVGPPDLKGPNGECRHLRTTEPRYDGGNYGHYGTRKCLECGATRDDYTDWSKP